MEKEERICAFKCSFYAHIEEQSGDCYYKKDNIIAMHLVAGFNKPFFPTHLTSFY
jgi:hypothetical protein